MAFQGASLVVLFTWLFLFNFSFASITINMSDKTHNRIKSICGQTQNPDFCVTSLEGYLGDNDADVNEIGIVSILMATAQARLTKAVVDQLIQNWTDPPTSLHLRACQTNYDVATKDLENAYHSSDQKDYNVMFDLVNHSNTMTTQCINECAQGQIKDPTLNEYNQKMGLLNNIALVTIGILKN